MQKLLVVEDSTVFRAIVEQQIGQELGIELVLAETMVQGLAAVEGRADEFFLALLDLTLPDAPNGEIVDAMLGRGIPVVVFTSRYDEALRETLLAKNVIDYVPKDSPASLKYLVSMVRRIQRNRETTALVVDDSATARQLARHLLELYQFDVREADSGQAALDALEAEPGIRLVITDYNMPGMDGFELIQHLRRRFDRDELAIIGVSAGGDAPLSAKFIKYGANDFLNKPYLREEFFCRISQNMEMLDNIRALREAAGKDFLTGLPNRRSFFEIAGALHAAARRDGARAFAAMIDVDHFKRVNDTHGHDAGDAVLREIGRLLPSLLVRESDVVARLGGEEFAVFAYDVTPETAASFFESVRQAVADAVIATPAGALNVTVSIGVSCRIGDSLQHMLNAADACLYDAKAAGRDRVVSDAEPADLMAVI